MRPALLLALALAACADAPPDGPPPEADAEALRLLDSVDRDALAEAFDALDAAPYTASVEVRMDGTAESATVEVDGDRVEVRDRVGIEREPSDEAPRLRDPLQTALPEDPPYLDPATRDQYRLGVVGDTTVGGRRLRLVEAAFVEGRRKQPVRRVRAAVDPASGAVGMVEVTRAADSAVYDEASRVRVDLVPVGETWLPRRVRTDTRTDVPMAPARHVRTDWTVIEAAGRRLGPDAPRRDSTVARP